jgi:membrane-bound serine protease (ClpP class)
LAVEIFILPGFGITGISGIILIGLSLILSMQDFVIPRFAWEWDLLGRNTLVVSLGILAAVTGIAIIALLGPRIKIFDRLTLKTSIAETASGLLTAADPLTAAGRTLPEPEDNCAGLAGKQGIAVSTLRPSGKAEIEGRLYPVEGDGEFIASGTAIRVTRVQGNIVTVRPLVKG